MLKHVDSQRESLLETLMEGFKPSNSAVVLDYNGDEIPANAIGTAIIKQKREQDRNRLSIRDRWLIGFIRSLL